LKATFEQLLDFGATFEQLIRVLEQLLSNFLRKLEQLVDSPKSLQTQVMNELHFVGILRYLHF
jgi:hypothetical protein